MLCDWKTCLIVEKKRCLAKVTAEINNLMIAASCTILPKFALPFQLLVLFDSVSVCSLSFYFSHKVEEKISSVSLTSRPLVSAWNIYSFFAQVYARRLFIFQLNPRLIMHLHFDNVTILESDCLSRRFDNTHRLRITCTRLLLTSVERSILINAKLYCSTNTLMKQLIPHFSKSQFQPPSTENIQYPKANLIPTPPTRTQKV